jgi:hypothetical protein
MCYSAQIWSDYKKYVRAFGVEIDIKEYVELFWHRNENDRIKIPKAMEESFAASLGVDEARIKGLIDEYVQGSTSRQTGTGVVPTTQAPGRCLPARYREDRIACRDP